MTRTRLVLERLECECKRSDILALHVWASIAKEKTGLSGLSSLLSFQFVASPAPLDLIAPFMAVKGAGPPNGYSSRSKCILKRKTYTACTGNLGSYLVALLPLPVVHDFHLFSSSWTKWQLLLLSVLYRLCLCINFGSTKDIEHTNTHMHARTQKMKQKYDVLKNYSL